MFDDEERCSLELLARGGYREARDRLILGNEGLIRVIAKQYRDKGLTDEDLIQEGYLGLIRSIDRFDDTLGTKMSGVAWMWITDAIETAIARNRSVRLPRRTTRLMFAWNEEIKKFRSENGRTPSGREVADRLGIRSKRLIAAVKGAARAYNMISERASWDTIAADEAKEGMDIEEALSGIDDRCRTVLVLRYGIGGGDPMTLREVGERLGSSYECVRKIEMKAMDQIRRMFPQ